MTDFLKIHAQVYKQGELFGVNKKGPNPFATKGKRKNSVAIAGGALGDEGKGRITDDLTAMFLKKSKKVFHYRDNGGANAGHTVEVGDMKIALHQLGSGVTQKGCITVIGKEMVVHPEDLVLEIEQVLAATGKKKLPAELLIDEMSFLCLDTHRAFEQVLKARSTGSMGATGRGISPAYADIVYRHPLQMRDLVSRNWQDKFKNHYSLYRDWIKGLGFDLKTMEVPRLDGSTVKVGSFAKMMERLETARKILKPFVGDIFERLEKTWEADTPMVFEKAQALGLDKRWGLYPDVTASDCSFEGIFSSTEGIIDPQEIAVKAATIKATYSSSVGARRLPTLIKNKLADRIREDANEYGATTKRPRDIAYIDLPMLSFLFKTGRVEYLTITHLDISYLDVPIKVCVGYNLKGKAVDYRPDQEFLDNVKPVYVELPPWDGQAVQQLKNIQKAPKEMLQYLAFISQSLGAKMFMGTTGPKRDQTLRWW